MREIGGSDGFLLQLEISHNFTRLWLGRLGIRVRFVHEGLPVILHGVSRQAQPRPLFELTSSMGIRQWLARLHKLERPITK